MREARLAWEKRKLRGDPLPATVTQDACPPFSSMVNVVKVAMLVAPQLEATPMCSIDVGGDRSSSLFAAQIVVTDTLAPLLAPESGSHHMSVEEW